MKIGFLGPLGTFSQQAALKYTEKSKVNLKPYLSIPHLIRASNTGEIDECIVPIENSIEGSVTATLDLLAWESRLSIKAEVLVPIEHCLMAKKGTKKIDKIFSHPQAVGQCREFLEDNHRGIPCERTASTAKAAELVANSEGNYAAIASRIAADLFDLEIIENSIQSKDNNVTRFIVLSAEKTHRTGKDKTSLVFSTHNTPGALCSVLQVLDVWGLNMSRIESRPAKEKLGTYIFFIDLGGHIEDHAIKEAMELVKKRSGFFKILGSYPAG